MDQREAMMLPGSAPYYVHRETAESVMGLQGPPSINPLSNPTVHFQSNAGGSLFGSALPLETSSTMSPHRISVGMSPVGPPPPAMLQGEPVRRGEGQGNMDVTDVKRKIMLFSRGRHHTVILSAIGVVSAVNMRSSGGGTLRFEGRFDILNLTGSYNDALHGPAGCLNLTLVGPDGRVSGGVVEDVMIAASRVQVVVATLSPRTPKTKNNAGEGSEASADPGDRTVGSLGTPATANAASGIAVDDDCKLRFLELKAKRNYRYIVFKIDGRGQQVTVEKAGDHSETYQDFADSLPSDECRYAVFDYDFTTNENCHKSKIFFIAW
ncbi:hypothetical protein DH2020_023167 [Rehmannia glutinosa]|uniref:ADF-H domain-containing protein n=1 Tax=Rehmannia glutinosa TaxID=99300 RepID=A0ABR0W9Q7_REHGL